jgi:hypothetical protein
MAIAFVSFYLQYNTVHYNTIQYSTVRYGTVQYGTVQYNDNSIMWSPISSQISHMERAQLLSVEDFHDKDMIAQ